MDRFDVERSCVMKKYLSLKGVLITSNIPEKAYITSGTFHNSDTSDNLTLYYPSPVAHSCEHPDFGCHVTSRNQGTFSREEERGPWVRGWENCIICASETPKIVDCTFFQRPCL